jgi:glycosyltransferase involved in cell wall biosynthesis
MSQPRPEISVLISTYNDREYVEKKLAEIEAQTAFGRAEFIFIEPASPGRERELLEPFCARHANCKLIALEERVGLYRAWNLGWEGASAPLVCISNMDDMMHPCLLEQVIEGMRRNIWDVATVLIARQELDSEWNSWEMKRLTGLDLNTRPGAFFAWRCELKDRIGMFDERLEMIGDKDFWARVEHENLQMGIIPKLLYLYSKHPDQLSKKEEFRAKKAKELAICREKDYAHVWPASLQRRVRLLRCSKWLPFGRNIYPSF